MPNLWFRMYSEFADDPKVQMLPEHMQRRLVMLMCSRCKEESVTDSQLAFLWRISDVSVTETKKLFLANGFIDKNWDLVNWNRRQFISDSSADRTRRYRDKLKRHDVTPVTNSDGLDTDTEQIQKHKNTIAPSLEQLDAGPPKLGSFPCVGKTKTWHFTQKEVDEWLEAYPGIDLIAELRAAKQWLIANHEKQKTASGMPRYLNRWLSKAQNSHGAGPVGYSPEKVSFTTQRPSE